MDRPLPKFLGGARRLVDNSGSFVDRLGTVCAIAKQRIGRAPVLAQGMSVSFSGGPSVTIKSHHNVGGLPERKRMKLVEPLRELFKDEVRVFSHINPPSMSQYQSLKSIHWRSTIAHVTHDVPGSGFLPTGEGRRNLLSRLRHSGRSRVVPGGVIYKYIDANKTNLCGGSRGLNDGRGRHLFGPEYSWV